jgi:hypothetical protein
MVDSVLVLGTLGIFVICVVSLFRVFGLTAWMGYQSGRKAADSSDYCRKVPQ